LTAAEDWNDVLEADATSEVQGENEAIDRPEVQNEAIDRPEAGPNGILPAVEGLEEDPDAWRTVRFDEDSGQIHATLVAIAEKSPAAKRAIHSLATARVEREFREREQELTEQLEQERTRALRAEVQAGDQFWGRMNPQQRGEYLGKNPAAIEQFNNWVAGKRQMQESLPPVQPWIKNLVNTAQELVEKEAPYLTEEQENFFRAQVRNKDVYAQYKDNPHQLILDLREAIDSARAGANNGAVQTDATPRTPATGTTGARTRNGSSVQGNPTNPNIGKHAPDPTRKGSPGGSNGRYTQAEFEVLDDDLYEVLLKRHGVKTGQELFRIVGVA